MKTFVMIPTYNEKENIMALIDEIMKLKIGSMHIAVVDDNSPDGTWKIVEELSKKSPNIHLLLRKQNKGRGSAGRDGFVYCLKNNADAVVEMDADLSHNPAYIPRMLEELKNADVVLGSRIIKGGRDVGRSLLRRIITRLANLYIRLMLGLSVRDCNSGFRCFKRNVLEAINLNRIASKGPSIVQEVLFKAHLHGFKIKEIPIVFTEREKGKSKLGFKQLIAAYIMVMKLKILHIMGMLK